MSIESLTTSATLTITPTSAAGVEGTALTYCFESVNFNIETDVKEQDCSSSTSKSKWAGIKRWSGSFSAAVDDTTDLITALTEVTNTFVWEFAAVDSASQTETLAGSIIPSRVVISGDKFGYIKMAVDFEGNGAISDTPDS